MRNVLPSIVVTAKDMTTPSPTHRLPRLSARWSCVVVACAALTAVTAPASSEPIETCDSAGQFVRVLAGPFIASSDAAERDLAYRISAEAAAVTPEARAATERSLRASGWFDAEPARHVVTLSATCIGRHPITNTEYEAFVRDTGHRAPGITAAEYQNQGFLAHPYTEIESYFWRDGGYPAGQGHHPVVLVSHADATAFARWKGHRDGRTYRLPTADEWEKASRGPDGRIFAWGNTWRPDGGTWSRDGTGHTAPVGSFPAGRSSYGIDDTAGNVFEFTSTRSAAAIVMKGCSFDDLPGFCRPAYQHLRPADSRHILFGFRLVRE